MSAHTPGPWHYKSHAVDSNYMLIFCHPKDADSGDSLRGYCGEANARLIAAAPDLLEMLQHVVRWHDQLGTADIANMRKVIAEATGSAS